MDCPVLRERLTLYAENMLDDRGRRQVEGHLETCAACRATLEQIVAMRTLLRNVPPVEVPAETVQEAAEGIHRAISRSPRRRPASIRALSPRLQPVARHPAFVGIVAAVVLVVALLWGLGRFERSAPSPPRPPEFAEQEVDFYLQEHALSADQGMLTGDNFSWMVVADRGDRNK